MFELRALSRFLASAHSSAKSTVKTASAKVQCEADSENLQSKSLNLQTPGEHHLPYPPGPACYLLASAAYKDSCQLKRAEGRLAQVRSYAVP